jgi:hypothetical protein
MCVFSHKTKRRLSFIIILNQWPWASLDPWVNVYPKANVLPLPFASNNIYSLGRLDWEVNLNVDVREGAGVHHNFAPILLLFSVNGIRGAKHLPTTFTHMFGTLGVNFDQFIPPSKHPMSYAEIGIKNFFI